WASAGTKRASVPGRTRCWRRDRTRQQHRQRRFERLSARLEKGTTKGVAPGRDGALRRPRSVRLGNAVAEPSQVRSARWTRAGTSQRDVPTKTKKGGTKLRHRS